MPSFPPRIYLTGFMGAGKSTIGRLLAAKLGYRYIDLDDAIEKHAGKSIPEIFAADGEPGFRRLETETLDASTTWPDVVISTGGGALASDRGLATARSGGFIVFLDVPEDLIVDRLFRNDRRPLIERVRTGGRPSIAGFVHDSLAARRPYYEQAHLTIETGPATPSVIVNEIIDALDQISRNDRR